MTDLDLLQFELLKKEIQVRFIASHTPSEEDISQWKGIDIVYFQEDLLKTVKGNLSEKSFYTYFKTSPVTKLPRIDILNLLSQYAGYNSWYDFKNNHEQAFEILNRENTSSPATPQASPIVKEESTTTPAPQNSQEKEPPSDSATTDYEPNFSPKEIKHSIKKYLWIGISAILTLVVVVLLFADSLFSKTYTFHFMDEDRGRSVQNTVEIKVLKEGESPINYRVKPNKDFIYQTKDKVLRMVVSSIYYHTDTIIRNLEDAPQYEIIELKPNEYNMMLYSYSTTKDFNKRRAQLNQLISDNAIIYQVFDNRYFSVETMTKQRYIAFLSLPTTSLENLDVIETKIKNGKIILIKFRIKRPDNENQ